MLRPNDHGDGHHLLLANELRANEAGEVASFGMQCGEEMKGVLEHLVQL